MTRLALSVLTFASLAAFAPAEAQIQQLPSTSRGEAAINQMNRDIGQQQQIRGIEQQGTINSNQTRMQIDTAPHPVTVQPPVVVPAR